MSNDADQNKNEALFSDLADRFPAIHCGIDCLSEPVLDVPRDHWVAVAEYLRDEQYFEQLIDLCGVDFLHYGAEGVMPEATEPTSDNPDGVRFRVVCHLLSISRNQRIRVRTDVDTEFPTVRSLCEVWAVTNWFEREAFDLFGIVFEGHPDLRRLLTDYGFIGHPFRKDFPLSGHVEMRYDPEKGRVVYQPVTIEPRVLVPRTITTSASEVIAETPAEQDSSSE